MPNAQILSHFQHADPVMYRLLQQCQLEPLPAPPPHTDFFAKLAREIIAQQLSSKAAAVIINRFNQLFPDGLTPEAILARPEQDLRDVGLSWAKVRYVRDLAQQTQEGVLVFDNLQELDDETIITHLTQVKGIGRWTAEMFLMFTLGRADVFSHGDLGLKKGMIKFYGLEEGKDFQAKVEAIVSQWSPYKSYGSLALWYSLDNFLER